MIIFLKHVIYLIKWCNNSTNRLIILASVIFEIKEQICIYSISLCKYIFEMILNFIF